MTPNQRLAQLGFAGFVVLAIALALWLLVRRDSAALTGAHLETAAAALPEPSADPLATAAPREARDAASERTRVAAEPAPAAEAASTVRPELAVSGRVVDEAGQGIAGAEVRVLQRERIDFERVFRGGPPGRERGASLRARFQRRPLAPPVLTAADGTFTLRGGSFAEAELAIAARDGRRAPAVVLRTWRDTGAALELGDIVLPQGRMLRGVVVDDGGVPIRGAEVRYESDEQRGFERGLPLDDALADLVAPATTDAAGRFAIGPVPPQRCVLSADAPRHVRARTATIDPERDGDAEQHLVLVRAARLAGVVRDPAGAPIAGAVVEATAMRGDAAWPRERGRRRGWNGFGGARPMDFAITDAEGRFELSKVEPRLVQLEVQHPRFVAATLEAVDPARALPIEVVLEPALLVQGTVADARTGRPVETFGIAVRPARGGEEAPPWRAASAEGARAEAESERRAFLAERIGGSGELPEETPEPSAHAGGAFVLEGLAPGEYVFDVDAPGYVKIAAGPIALPSAGPVRIAVERGCALSGHVVRMDGTPVAGADVQLLLPEAPPAAPDANEGDGRRGERGGPGGFRRFFQRALARATTDETGAFALPPVRAGVFTLQASAPGLLDTTLPDVVLATNRSDRDVVVRMSAGGTVRGVVIDYDPARDARVLVTPATEGAPRSSPIDPTGAYEIAGLPSGGYFAMVLGNGAETDGRRMMMRFLGRPSGAADFFVEENTTVRFDVTADDAGEARITGTVRRNGAPATGLEVRLAHAAPEPDAGDPAARFRRGAERRLSSARVSAKGEFELDGVPAGVYELEVSASPSEGRRFGGGDGAVLHRQQIQVGTGTTAVAPIDLFTGEVEFTVRMAEDEAAAARLSVSLVSAAEAGDRPFEQWSALPSLIELPVRRGTTGVCEIGSGSWRYAVHGRGVATVSGTVVVGSVRATVPLEIAPPASTEPRAPGR
jgi:protocatechuate 3,4-dioxygenase beta subunit